MFERYEVTREDCERAWEVYVSDANTMLETLQDFADRIYSSPTDDQIHVAIEAYLFARSAWAIQNFAEPGVIRRKLACMAGILAFKQALNLKPTLTGSPMEASPE